MIQNQKLKKNPCGQMDKVIEFQSDNDSITTCGSETCDQLQPYIELEDSESVKEKYNDLQNSSMSVDNDNFNSFLLPSFLPDCGNVTVTVKGMNNTVLKAAAETFASKYIKKVVEQRNNAVKLTLHYRDLQ